MTLTVRKFKRPLFSFMKRTLVKTLVGIDHGSIDFSRRVYL